MAIRSLWLQNVAYPARFDRQLIAEAFGSRQMVLRGLVVTQHATGDNTVDISTGAATVIGDDVANQGLYLLVNEDPVSGFAMPALPGSNSRYDMISLRVNDPQAGGPVGDNGTFVVTQGAVAVTPVAPTPPTSAIPLYLVKRTAGDPAILSSMITDIAARGLWPYTISTSGPPAILPDNYLWVQVS